MTIAKEVLQIAEILKQHDYQAYLVGGCLRDILMHLKPKDWDLATDAKPEEIQKLFPDSVYENRFGTVGVKTNSDDPTLRIIEITTFRKESAYSDKRHPDAVHFAKTIEEDLARRDFTVNAMALNLGKQTKKKDLVDPFEGQKDLENKVIRAVGEAAERFEEDALRLMRAVRFSAQIRFTIDQGTENAIKEKAGLLEFVSKERVRDEFTKLILTSRGHEGVEAMRLLGLLQHVIPELLEGVDVEQNEHHVFSVYEHNLKSLEYAVNKNYSLEIRLAALLHDVGKPKTRAWKSKANGKKTYRGKRGDWTFYGHQVVGAKMAAAILQRLKFPSDVIEKATLLVYEHMFVYDPEVVTLAGVRRLLSRVGSESIDDLIRVREADRIGSGVPKAQPYRLRYLMAMIEKVKTDPVSAKMLKVNGDILMKELGIPPSLRLGQIIAILLEEVLDDPTKNDKRILLERARDLTEMTDVELKKMAQQSKQRALAAQEKIDEEIKSRYFVK